MAFLFLQHFQSFRTGFDVHWPTNPHTIFQILKRLPLQLGHFNNLRHEIKCGLTCLMINHEEYLYVLV